MTAFRCSDCVAPNYITFALEVSLDTRDLGLGKLTHKAFPYVNVQRG